jgi:hypothetical protein
MRLLKCEFSLCWTAGSVVGGDGWTGERVVGVGEIGMVTSNTIKVDEVRRKKEIRWAE